MRPNVKIRIIGEHKDPKGMCWIFLVNGKLVREHYDINFTMGGHHYRYNWIPENEIWIDNSNYEERAATILHECYERDLMKYKKVPYGKAHDKSNIKEKAFRMAENKRQEFHSTDSAEKRREIERYAPYFTTDSTHYKQGSYPKRIAREMTEREYQGKVMDDNPRISIRTDLPENLLSNFKESKIGARLVKYYDPDEFYVEMTPSALKYPIVFGHEAAHFKLGHIKELEKLPKNKMVGPAYNLLFFRQELEAWDMALSKAPDHSVDYTLLEKAILGKSPAGLSASQRFRLSMVTYALADKYRNKFIQKTFKNPGFGKEQGVWMEDSGMPGFHGWIKYHIGTEYRQHKPYLKSSYVSLVSIPNRNDVVSIRGETWAHSKEMVGKIGVPLFSVRTTVSMKNALKMAETTREVIDNLFDGDTYESIFKIYPHEEK